MAAQISSNFSCMVCKQNLNFPNDLDITSFIILILQFYKSHGLCENLAKPATAAAEKPEKAKPSGRKNKKK